MVPEYYDIENSERTEDELSALRQVCLVYTKLWGRGDVPTTMSDMCLKSRVHTYFKVISKLSYNVRVRSLDTSSVGIVEGHCSQLVSSTFCFVMLACNLVQHASGWRRTGHLGESFEIYLTS